MVHLFTRLIPWLFPKAKVRFPEHKKVIYLTFDDGPTEECLPFILDTLKQYNAKASFFCVGENLANHPTLVEAMYSGEHAVSNHTFNHLNGWKTETKNYINNTHQAAAFTSEKSNFRPPYGKLTLKQYNALKKHYNIVFWDILTEDYNSDISPEQCLKNALRATDGSIVVFHDNIKSRHNMQFALPRFLEHYTQRGFTFKVLPAEN